MGFYLASNISSHGMSVHRQIMDLISENLANVNTIRTADGVPYRRKVPVVASQTIQGFGSLMQQHMYQVAKVVDVAEDQAEPRLDYDPSNPLADSEGYVQKPNINVSLEMVRMINATRAYEANVAAFNASKTMANRALTIGS